MWFQVLHTPLSCPSAAQPAPKQCMFWNGTLMQNCTARWNRECVPHCFQRGEWAALHYWQSEQLGSALTSSTSLASNKQSLHLEITALRVLILLGSVLHMLPKRGGRQWLQHSAVHQLSWLLGFTWVSWPLLIFIFLVSPSINLLSFDN